jgi:hypothetical protein
MLKGPGHARPQLRPQPQTRGAQCVHTSLRAPQLTGLTVTRPAPSPSTQSKGGACCATASSCSTTPANSCRTAGRFPRTTRPASGGPPRPESVSWVPQMLRPARFSRRWPVGCGLTLTGCGPTTTGHSSALLRTTTGGATDRRKACQPLAHPPLAQPRWRLKKWPHHTATGPRAPSADSASWASRGARPQAADNDVSNGPAGRESLADNVNRASRSRRR